MTSGQAHQPSSTQSQMNAAQEAQGEGEPRSASATMRRGGSGGRGDGQFLDGVGGAVAGVSGGMASSTADAGYGQAAP